MRFAAIADIHGNSAALDAVLADIRDHGIDAIVDLGDIVSGPLDAAGTLDRLIGRDIVHVRGNHDRYLIEQDPEGMGSWERPAYAQLDARQLAWLRDLPLATIWRDEVFLCHATPQDDETYWLEQVTPDGIVTAAASAGIERRATGVDQSLILCGHSHIARAVRLGDGRMIVNPGSVGCQGYLDPTPPRHVVQTGSPDARYAILERNDGAWSVTFRHVRYDPAEMIALARARGEPGWARVLETGWL